MHIHCLLYSALGHVVEACEHVRLCVQIKMEYLAPVPQDAAILLVLTDQLALIFVTKLTAQHVSKCVISSCKH